MAQTLQHSQADVIRRLLVDLGVGTDPKNPPGSWPIYAADEPDAPDNAITVYDTAGTDDADSMVDGSSWKHWGFQVRVRSQDHKAGWTKMDEVRTALTKIATTYDKRVHVGTSSLYAVHCVAHVGHVIPLGKEQGSRRKLFTWNATAVIEQLS